MEVDVTVIIALLTYVVLIFGICSVCYKMWKMSDPLPKADDDDFCI